MATWSDVETEAPELAARAKALFDAHVHKTIATLRQDGSPRISGIEVTFVEGGLWTGSMWEAVKALDLRRDPRFALHSGSDDPKEWKGDAKVAGRAEEVTDPGRRAQVVGGAGPVDASHLFRLDLDELVVVRLGEPADHIVVEAWHPGRGITRRERR